MQASNRVYPVLLTLVAGWCVLLVTAPLLRIAGAPAEIPDFLYRLFSPICHQFDDRSFHLEGEKLAVCIRCSSIYFSFFLAVACYPLLHRWHRRSAPSPALLLIASVPMLLDVLLNLSGLHFSTEWTRLVSGAVFGGVLPLYILPPLKEAALQLSFLRGGSVHARKAQ